MVLSKINYKNENRREVILTDPVHFIPAYKNIEQNVSLNGYLIYRKQDIADDVRHREKCDIERKSFRGVRKYRDGI
jgi:hypothetical protein